MAASITKPKVAVVTSKEVGKPDLSRLAGAARLVYSCDVGLEAALDGACAVFLWDVALIDEIRQNWHMMTNIQWMHVAVTGVDTMCFDEMKRSAIKLTNAGGVYNYAISEYVTHAVISHERNLPRIHYQKKNRQWRPFVGSSCSGKNALIIGPGQIGRTCARSLRALGMNVRGVGTRERAVDPDFDRIDSFYQLEDVIGWAHHVILCCPLTEDTYHLINAPLLKQCRPKTHLVNVARGPVVDTDALVFALKEGIIGGATLDVFEEEPLSPLSPLWDISSVVITPHIAGEVCGFEEALIDQFVENAFRFLRREELFNVVDKMGGYLRQPVV